MAKGTKSVAVLALLAAVVVLLMAEAGQAAIDCTKARGQLAPCAPYLTGNAADPSAICCKGVEYIKDNADTKADRQAACQCLKDTAAAMANLKDSAAQQLPTKCNVPISVPISKTVDCNK